MVKGSSKFAGGDDVGLSALGSVEEYRQARAELTRLVLRELCGSGSTGGDQPEKRLEDVVDWAMACGLSSIDFFDRLVQRSGVTPLPVSPAHPTGAALSTAERILQRSAAVEVELLPWLPIDTIGPFLVVAHYCPFSTNFAGLPEDVIIKVLVSVKEYDDLLRKPSFTRVFVGAARLRHGVLPPARLVGEAEWLDRLVQVGAHPDADSLDRLDPVEARERLQQDPVVIYAVRTRMKNGRMLPTMSLAGSLEAFESIPLEVSQQFPAFCYFVNGSTRYVLVSDLNREGELQDLLNRKSDEVLSVVASEAEETEIRRLVQQMSGGEILDMADAATTSVYNRDRTIEVDPKLLAALDNRRLKELIPDEAQGELVVAGLVYRTMLQQSSDLHIDPSAHSGGSTLRNRIDGCCRPLGVLPAGVDRRIISLIKGKANMNPQLRALPQDGKFSVRFGNALVEVRVSTVPVRGEESLVMRLQLRGTSRFTIDKLNLPVLGRELLMEAIQAPYGLIAVCGATGSGKTTSIDAVLNYLNTTEVTVLTIEDPVELIQDGAKQIEINHTTGMTFRAAREAALRQDPDIINMGEIRDQESADSAMVLSNTGHLVFATVHTNDALSLMRRMFKDFKVSPDQFSGNLVLVIAQTLKRKLCSCAVPRAVNDVDRKWFRFAGYKAEAMPDQIMARQGCAHCGSTGYRGRQVVMEFLPKTPDMKELIYADAPRDELLACARQYGFRTLFESSMDLVARGVLDLDEARSVFEPFSQLPKIVP